MLRDATPQVEGAAWAADGGEQPAPAFMPAIYNGAPYGVKGVSLTLFDAERIGWRLRLAAPRDGAKVEGRDWMTEPLGEADAHRVLAAIALGNPPAKGAALPRAGAGLSTDDSGALVLAPPGEGGASVPYVLMDGRVTPAGLEKHAARRRASLCIAGGGYVAIASSVADSDESNALVLGKLGCMRAVALDRGAHAPWTMDRAGTDAPPLTHYGQSVLYAVGKGMAPRAFRWAGTDAPAER
jgi:hypothetical protein